MTQQNSLNKPGRFGCLQVLGIVGIAVVVTAVATFFIAKAYLFPPAFTPVTLSSAEEKALAAKLERLDPSEGGNGVTPSDARPAKSDAGPLTTVPPETEDVLEPEAYSEKGLKREISLTEREVNGLLANNTDLADKLAVDLSDNLISANLRLPMDKDFPVLGGKILRLRSGVELDFKNGKPVVILKGVTVMGVPLPNAWLGGLKNMDLVETFGAEAGFWKTFSDGIESIHVEDGYLKIRLKE